MLNSLVSEVMLLVRIRVYTVLVNLKISGIPCLWQRYVKKDGALDLKLLGNSVWYVSRVARHVHINQFLKYMLKTMAW